MKSEKAKKILSASSITDSYGYEYLLMSCAEKAVECAEQEAEERMREKAVKAFISCCHCVLPQYMRNKCETCEAYKSFIQKLNEG